MNVSTIAETATALSEARTNQAVGIAVLKKAIDQNAENALSLISALPNVQNLPNHLGRNINVVA